MIDPYTLPSKGWLPSPWPRERYELVKAIRYPVERWLFKCGGCRKARPTRMHELHFQIVRHWGMRLKLCRLCKDCSDMIMAVTKIAVEEITY